MCHHSPSGTSAITNLGNPTQNEMHVTWPRYQRNMVDSKCGGVVLALNARTLALEPGIFDDYFAKFPKSQILAWTGAGEPIPRSTIEEIKEHFKATGCSDRVGFDCDIA